MVKDGQVKPGHEIKKSQPVIISLILQLYAHMSEYVQLGYNTMLGQNYKLFGVTEANHHQQKLHYPAKTL